MKYFQPADDNPARIMEIGKDFAKKRYFKDIEFSVKIRDIHKIEKRVVSALFAWTMKARKNIKFMLQKILAKDMFVYH